MRDSSRKPWRDGAQKSKIFIENAEPWLSRTVNISNKTTLILPHLEELLLIFQIAAFFDNLIIS